MRIILLSILLFEPSLYAQDHLWQLTTSSGYTYSNISELQLYEDTLKMKMDSNIACILIDSITNLRTYNQTSFYSCFITGAYIGSAIGAVTGITMAFCFPSYGILSSKNTDNPFLFRLYSGILIGGYIGFWGGLFGGVIGSLYYFIVPSQSVDNSYELSHNNHSEKMKLIHSILEKK